MSIISRSSVNSSDNQSVEDTLIDQLPPKVIKKNLAARRTREYMVEFERFLGQKLASNRKSQNRISRTNEEKNYDTTDLIANQINKRKLLGNNSEARVNRMMDGFKTVDTYVNVKNFIQDMNAVNRVIEHKRNASQIKPPTGDDGRFYQSINQQRGLGQLECNQHSKQLLERVNNYLRPHMKNKSQQKLQQFDEFYRVVDSVLTKTEYILSDTNSDIVELTKQCRAKPELSSRHSDQNHSSRLARRQQPREAKKLVYLVDSLEPPVINNKYCQQFHQNLVKIEKKMQQTLKNMYQQKWDQIQKNRKLLRHSQQSADSNINRNKKPILNEKYRIFAPRNLFRYQVGNHIYDESELPNSPAKRKAFEKTTKQQRYRPSSTSHTPNQTRNSMRKSDKQNITKTFSSTHHRNWSDSSINPIFNHSKFKIMQNQSKYGLKDTLRQNLKQNYRFRKPMIKQNILKRVQQFIKNTQTSQVQLKKQNHEIGQLIGKVQIQKALDFDRFNEQKVQISIDDVKKWAGVMRKKS